MGCVLIPFLIRLRHMLKTYQAWSEISLTVKVGTGIKHVTFDPKSLGASVFMTRDAKLQKGLESHPWFNDKYVLRESVDEEKLAEEEKKKAEAQVKAIEENSVITHHVDSLTEAKDYLADKFGISRTQLKGKDDILKYAKENNVVLEGI